MNAAAAHEIELGVSDFVALLNQTLEYSYPNVVIVGELANFRISKNRWVYFDLKDESATVRFFGTVYHLPGPLADGLLLRVRGQPRLHPLYGFSVNVLHMEPSGEGSIKKAAQLLQAKLAAEGLFDAGRKRPLPYPPASIGLITSRQSAAYADFVKILNARWHGLDIRLIDVQVQGEAAPAQITAALERFNAEADLPETIVIIRGGGSAEDLAAFSSEQVTRAVAASRTPTLVAIGHEIDLSLAELAADQRASTPSNAAELLVPDKRETRRQLRLLRTQLTQLAAAHVQATRHQLSQQTTDLHQRLEARLTWQREQLTASKQLLNVLSPAAILHRGYAIVRQQGAVLRRTAQTTAGAIVDIELADGTLAATVTEKRLRRHGTT